MQSQDEVAVQDRVLTPGAAWNRRLLDERHNQ